MFDNFFGINSLQDLSILAAITAIIVELIKDFIPKKIPTKAVAIVVGIIVSLIFFIILQGFAAQVVIKAILSGFVVSFISMNGFDSIKEIWKRVSKKEDDTNGE